MMFCFYQKHGYQNKLMLILKYVIITVNICMVTRLETLIEEDLVAELVYIINNLLEIAV